MALAELKEALALLVRIPVLWIPGIIGGAFAAITWLTLFISGAFFTGRLLLLFTLVLFVFTTGMVSVIRHDETTVRALVGGGLNYYFRVLLPQLVILFALLFVFILCTITVALLGLASDIGLVTFLAFGIMIPTLMLTFFSDMVAVFEEKRVFESIRRSVLLVSNHMMEVLSFFMVSALLWAGVIFGLMIVWEAILFAKLEPIRNFTEAQKEAFSPEQLLAMIGQDGIWVTAIILFTGVLILLPILHSYKACFYKKMAGSTVMIEQETSGEYDSKGRWYKY
jgi:hypothetical protein